MTHPISEKKLDVAALLEGTTPGPWGVQPTETRLWIGPMRANSAKVADIVAPIDWGNNYRDDYLIKQAANAALIAAAPRLAAEHIALTKKVDELEAALRPFAALAAPKTYPDAPDELGPSPLDSLEGKDGTGELHIATHFGTSRTITIWRDDFERARTALNDTTQCRESDNGLVG